MKQRPKYSALSIARVIVQVLFFIFLPALYFQTFTGIKQIYLALIQRQFSWSLWPQMAEAAIILPITLLAGRFFCGWMCAFGSFTDWIYRLSRKLFRRKLKITEAWDRRFKYLKYIILLVILVASWTFHASAFSSSSPWDVFGMLVTIGKSPDFPYVLSNLAIGFFLFLLIVVLSAFSERFFCRYLCPMGAIFSLVSRPKVLKINKPSAHCGNCRACTNHCAMGIPLYRMDTVSGGECIGCMKCVSICPRNNVSLGVAGGKVRPLAAGITAAAFVAAMYYTAEPPIKKSEYTGSVSVSQSGTQSQTGRSKTGGITGAESSGSSLLPSGKYKDGMYQGEGSGFRGGKTEVTVVVASGKIQSITVDSTEDSPNFFDTAYAAVSKEIIDSQSPDVDAVSGATYSSKGIMEAVADALKDAKV